MPVPLQVYVCRGRLCVYIYNQIKGGINVPVTQELSPQATSVNVNAVLIASEDEFYRQAHWVNA